MSVVVATARGELVRALGSVALTPPPHADVVCDALDLPHIDGVEHTEAFVLLAPPHAAIHLGAEGKLGGEGLDRVEGFWRVLGADVPRDADHLGVLLMAYAELSESVVAGHAAATLFHEHIWSWAPGYLTALSSCGLHGVTAWCELTLDALAAELVELDEPVLLPLALREAPAALHAEVDLEELLDAVVAPVRSGVVLTQRELAVGARELGVGYRRGERRFALKAMLEQDKRATLRWLAAQATRWSGQHADTDPTTATGRWWSTRATRTAAVLTELAEADS